MNPILISDPKQLPTFSASTAARDLYMTMEKMRQAALDRNFPWSEYPTLQDYAEICFWAIRRMEYGFIAEQFAAIEEQSKRPLKVLDVGCGVVPLNNWIANRGHEVIALDPLHEDISFLVKNNMNQFYGTDVAYITAAGEGLPFPNQYFDIVTSVSVLEHTVPGNDRLILDEIARVLNPAGHLLISFDVSPPHPKQEGEPSLPEDFRPYSYPFHPKAVRRLFTWLSRYFNITVEDVPSSLDALTWEDVHAFWQQLQAHDGRDSALREYLALGNVLKRNNLLFQQKTDEVSQAYLEGQAALVQQLSFYRHHADGRSVAIQNLLEDLQAQEKVREKLSQDLSDESKELNEKMKTILEFQTSYFFWLVNGPMRWLPFLWPLASTVRTLRRFFLPRVGVLDQYPPKPLLIPSSYLPEGDESTSQSFPSISIVTPSYNQGEFIERTLRSILDQGYPNLEYIVQDGDSKDGTLDLLRSYQPQLTFVDSQQDNGQAHAINMGFQRAKGEIMAFLNSDDILLPGALKYVADYFTSHPEIDVVYSHRVIINEKDQEIGRWILPPHDNDVILWADYIPQETLFWRRSMWEKVGGQLDESYRFALDWDLIMRFRMAGARFKRLPRFLAAFRSQAGQKTSLQMNSVGMSEMNRLRKQAHGRDVSSEEVIRNVTPYLKRSNIYHKLYRLGILRY